MGISFQTQCLRSETQQDGLLSGLCLRAEMSWCKPFEQQFKDNLNKVKSIKLYNKVVFDNIS